MADKTHHGSLNDTGPAEGAARAPGHDLPGDLTLLSLDQLMGIDLSSDAPLPRPNTLEGGAGADALNGGAGDDTPVWDVADSTIDGGAGTDTLRVDSGDVDLTTFGGAIQGIEKIDPAADAGANSVTLTMQDVVDISDTDVLTALGDGGDSVQADTGWTDGGIAGGFHTYTQGLATLLVDTDITVNADITA